MKVGKIKVDKIMDLGSAKDRAAVVLQAIMTADYHLITNSKGMTLLISGDSRWAAVVPNEVMQLLIDKDLIEIEYPLQ